MLGYTRAQPLALRAHHEDDSSSVVRLVIGHGSVGGRAVDPGLGLLRVVEEVGDVADLRDGQVLDGSGGRLAGGRGHLGAASLGDDDAGSAGTFGHARDGPEVPRVLNLIEYDDKRVLPREQAVRVGIRIWASLGADALVVVGAA